MPQNVGGDVDLSAITNGQPIDASDVTTPFADVVGVFNDILNGVQPFDRILFEDAGLLTISSGSITTTQAVHVVAAESSTSDDLDTITAANNTPILLKADTGDTITLRHGVGNINVMGGNNVTLSGNNMVMLYCLDDEWSVVGAGGDAPDILNIGAPTEVTIASGAITRTTSHHSVDTEADAASDDLDTINGGSEGDVLVIHAANTARTVTIKHNTGNIQMNGGVDFELDNTEKGLLLIYKDSIWIGIGGPFLAGAGSGTVTSVALSMPAEFSVAGSPIDSSGTLTVTKANQNANLVYAGPSSGGADAPAFRGLVNDDLPTVGIAKGGTGQTTQAAGFDALAPTTTEGDLIVRGSSSNGRLGVGSEDDVLTIVSGVPAWAPASGGGGGDIILIEHQETSGTDGGTLTQGAWQTRPLTVEVLDAGGHASLASNQVTLAAGTYELWAYSVGHSVNFHQARWQNITDGATVVLGSVVKHPAASQSGGISAMVTQFTIADSKVFELQHRCSATQGTDGLGNATGWGTEVYASVYLRKVA